MHKKILIVCYSQSGNTYRIACGIQKQTGGELCGIFPRQPYPMDYDSLLKQAKNEIKMGFIPHLLPISQDPAEYDVIFAGTPNWCDTAAPPLTAFFKKYKLKGKIIVPFCTHGGGGSGHIFKDIAGLCRGCEIKEGFSVNGRVSNVDKDISEWLKGLELL